VRQSPVVQLASVVTVQLPSVAQQAPVGVGCGQGFGAQTPPVRQSPVVQLAWVVTVQPPSVAQQAPVGFGCGQGFGEQVVLSPW
jgi:hypothetical protein